MMENKQKDLIQISMAYEPGYCEPDAHGYCATCADEALPARVLEIDARGTTALVKIKDQSREVDISLVDDVSIGQTLLVHGGVAVGSLGEEQA